MASVGRGMSAVLVPSGRVIRGLVLVRVADSGGGGGGGYESGGHLKTPIVYSLEN